VYPEGCDKGTGGANRHTFYSGCEEETAYLLEMRKNICHYAQIIDTYAPCIITSTRWNNDVNMEAYCTTTDRRVWNKKILSISNAIVVLNQLWKEVVCRSPESREEGKKGDLVGGLSQQHTMLKTKELTAFSSLTQSKGTWTDSDETNLPVSDLRVCFDTLLARTEQITHTFLQHFTDYTLYILPEQGSS
jgi:hypothetical protein